MARNFFKGATAGVSATVAASFRHPTGPMNPRSLLLPSLAADALALGTHWIYDAAEIAREHPDGIVDYEDPRGSYHRGKTAGDLTHCGDQTLVLLRSLVLRGGFSADGWREDWRRYWDGEPTSYCDGATRATLESLRQGDGTASASQDLAGAARIAPVLALLADRPLSERIAAARAQTALTHGDAATIEAAEFFTRCGEALVDGCLVPEALRAAAQVPYTTLDARAILAEVEAAAALDAEAAAERFGRACRTSEALPLTLWLLLRHAEAPLEALRANAMIGGDSAARGLLIGMVMGAAHGHRWMPPHWLDGLNAWTEIEALLALAGHPGEPTIQRHEIEHPAGHTLAAVLDLPPEAPRVFALFAHCFTCGKNLRAAARIARQLAHQGIATLRFDFTGIGESDGAFEGTSFRSNVEDLQVAAEWLRARYRAPELLIGHSLGGAAVLAAAPHLPECRAVVTVGAPADPAHVKHLMAADLETIRREGQAEVTLAGRRFTVGSRFLEDLEDLGHEQTIAALGRELLILHAPDDSVVALENAGRIYAAARHPKSFHALAGADHLLSDPADADHVARLIAVWAGRCVGRA